MRKGPVMVVLVAAGLVIAIPIAVIALGSDPAKVVSITADEARARVVEFVGRSDWTSDLTVSGPKDGASMRYYDVTGKNVVAAVNASDGTVTTVLLPPNLAVEPGATVTQEDAVRIAEQFVAEHRIDVGGLDRTVSLEDHGETSEWAVTWQGHAGAVTLPRFCEVGIDTVSGLVFRYVSINHPYDAPGEPTISQADAEAAARMVSGLPEVDKVELAMAFTDSGAQRLVYTVQLSGPIPGDPVSSVRLHAWVQVDATTGEAKVVAVG